MDESNPPLTPQEQPTSGMPAGQPPAPPTPAVALATQNGNSAEPAADKFNIDVSDNKQAKQVSFLKGILGGKDGAEGNAFTRIFGKNSLTSSAAGMPGQSNLHQLLGPVPFVSSAELFEKERNRKQIASKIFALSLLFAFIVVGYFSFELNPDASFLQSTFNTGPNTRIRFDASNGRLEVAQTNFNVVRFMRARLLLDMLNEKIEPYLAKHAVSQSELSTKSQQAIAESEMEILRGELKTELAEIQTLFVAPIGIDVFTTEKITADQLEQKFQGLVVGELEKRKSAILAESRDENRATNEIDNVSRIVSNSAFRSLIASAQLESLAEDEFVALLRQIREQGTDELSSIKRIADARLAWSKIISDIHTVTQQVDSLFGSGAFDAEGGIQYTSYTFDQESGKLSVRGQVKTKNSKTFTYISKLVEAIGGSKKFKNVDLPTFTKTKDETGFYSSTLSLQFELQNLDEIDPRDDEVQLELEGDFFKSGLLLIGTSTKPL